MHRISTREKFMLVFLSAIAYFMLDVPVQMTHVLPSYSGIKNFLPFTLGLFFGAYGICGCAAGCMLSALVLKSSISAAMYECFCIVLTGYGIFWGWHSLTKSHRILFKSWKDYGKYILLVSLLSALCLKIPVSASYFITGISIGIPVNILFSSLLYIEPVLPRNYSVEYDSAFILTSEPESLETANEDIESQAVNYGVNMKRIFEIQSCLEELAIRILKADNDAKISVTFQYGDAISIRLIYAGRKYNPFKIEADEDEIDIMSLKIIKHRALRASFSYFDGVNKVHVVV